MKERKVYSLPFAISGFKLLLFCFMLLGSLELSSQAASPYSRFGLGYINSPVFSANKGMGELSAAYTSGVNINVANPASYASLTRTTIEIGMTVDGANIHAQDSSYRASQVGMSHFVVSLVPNPKRNNYAFTLGLLPYSHINYTFIQDFTDSSLGTYRQVYTGTGSLYQAFVGGAYKIKGFSVGANLGFLFGKLDYQKTITFPDTVYAYSTRNSTSMNAKSFIYSVGVQYQKLIYHNKDELDPRTDIYMTWGAYGFGGMKMQAKVSNYWDRFTIDPTYGILAVDTASSAFNQKATMNLPFNVAGGVMFGNERFWMIGTDFKFTNWKNFTTPLHNGSLDNSWRLSFGAQITPKYDDPDKKKYFSRVQYRAGVYFGKSEVDFGGNHLSETGGTIGLGLPFKNIAHLNLTGDFGSRGGNDKTAIRENFYRVTIGFVLNDIWFIKRKYD